MSFEKSLRRFSRALVPVQPPVDLRKRVFSALPVIQPSPVAARATALGMLLVLGGGAFYSARLMKEIGSGADMRRAVEQAETWHFVGWRMKDEKQVRWEIWGQRSPYFYQERLGDDVIVDDGTRRIRLIPPDTRPGVGRKTGMAVLFPSRPSPTKPVPDTRVDLLPFARGNENHTWKNLRYIRQGSTTEGHITLRSSPISREWADTNLILTTDARTKLPVHVEIRDALYEPRKKVPRTTLRIEKELVRGELDVAYNVPLPKEVTLPSLPADYPVVDFTQGLPLGHRPDGSTTQNGLTLKAEATAQDDQGNIRLRFRALIGTTPIEAQKLPLRLEITQEAFGFEFMDRIEAAKSLVFRQKHYATDDLGNHYCIIDPPPISQSKDSPEVYLVPVVPRSPDAPRPKRLNLRVYASLLYPIRAELAVVAAITQERMLLSIPLSSAPKIPGIGYDAKIASQRYKAPQTLALQAAIARSHYYSNWGFFQYNPDFSTADVIRHSERNIYWAEVILDETERAGDTKTADFFRQVMAKRLRNKRERFRLLEDYRNQVRPRSK